MFIVCIGVSIVRVGGQIDWTKAIHANASFLSFGWAHKIG